MLGELRRNFRLWWQKPIDTAHFRSNREVTFLELFYDLVYVVLIAAVAHHLAHNLSWSGLFEFIFMFFFIMWTWINGMFYHSLHGNNDVSMRIFTFSQMLLVGGMTFFVGDIFIDSAAGFAITFGLFELLFAVLWFRTGYHDPEHRPASTPYAIIYGITALAALYSATLTNTQTLYVLGIILFVNISMPFVSGLRANTRDIAERSNQQTMDSVERFGLITIIALGEVIVSSINGFGELDVFTLRNATIAVLGVLIAIGLWWVYFDSISRRLPVKGLWPNTLYTFLHIPVVMSIAGVGAVLREMITHNNSQIDDTTRWIFVLLLGIGLFTIASIVTMVRQESKVIKSYTYKLRNSMILSGTAVLALGFTALGYIGILSLSVVFLMLPVLYAILIWVRIQNQHRSKVL